MDPYAVAARLDISSLASPTCSLWACFVAGGMRAWASLLAPAVARQAPGMAPLWARARQ
jgi:hypothetical protein